MKHILAWEVIQDGWVAATTAALVVDLWVKAVAASAHTVDFHLGVWLLVWVWRTLAARERSNLANFRPILIDYNPKGTIPGSAIINWGTN